MEIVLATYGYASSVAYKKHAIQLLLSYTR